MRILLLTDSNVFAGTERHILDLAAALTAAGAKAAVAAPSPSPLADRCRENGIEFHIIQKGGNYDRAAAKTIARLFSEDKIDVVHAHNGRTALIATLARRSAGCGAVVFTQHFLDPAHIDRPGIGGLVSRVAHKWLDNRISQTIAISAAVRDKMVARNPKTAGRITVVHNGISDPIGKTPPARELVRNRLAVADNIPLIVCAARLEEEKGIPLLIDAMAQITRDFPAAQLLIAGQGSQQAATESHIARLGLQNKIRLLGFRPDVLEIISAADVFVLPARAEPFGLVILEAMAVGRAVVAANSAGPREIVEHERSGLLVPHSSATDIAAAITRLLGSAELRQSIGQAARQRFLDRFTADRMAQNTLSVYQSAMAS
jgi:glycosyltransferase involved in cell wall biosynthesis